MLTALALIAAGLLLLVFGGNYLLRGAVTLAERLSLTPAIIGLTVVAAGTSVPELAVSVFAAIRGSADIAVGNVVGSNIVNISLLLGITALIRPLSIAGSVIKLEYPVMALATLMAVAVCQDGTIGRIDAALFLCTYVGFTAYMVSLVRANVSAEEERELDQTVAEIALPNGSRKALFKSLGFIALGIVLLCIGANLTVDGSVRLATMLGLSERVIGLTIVAIGTSLPEIVTSIVAALKGRADVAVGNLVGSNLFNILVILGASALILPISVSAPIIANDLPWMLAVALIVFPLIWTDRRLSRAEGGVLVAVYGAYALLLLR